jgi:hypothetical protein
MMELLSRHTREVGNLAFLGKVDRLRELLRDQPELARMTWGSAPLFWLPEDERAALEIVELFLANGADAAYRDRQGRTAADVARRRGLHDAAARLGRAAGGSTARRRPSVEDYERVAEAFVATFGSGDEQALERLRAHFDLQVKVEDVRAFVWRRVYNVRQRSGNPGDPYLTLDEARELVARESGFGNWGALIEAATAGRPAPGVAYQVDRKENKIGPRRALQPDEWDVLLGVMKEQRITALEANGQMTDALLARVAELDHVTALHLGGSRALTDAGLRHLARMRQLEELSVTGAITDRGLAVLRDLPNLRTLAMWWQQGISDEGVAHVAACDRIELVDLMGTHTGDGVIRALAGKPHLRRLKTGRQVTDAGLALLRSVPAFAEPPAGDPHTSYRLMDSDAGPTYLLLDGSFSNAGLAELAALAGVFALDFFWHVKAITSDGLDALARLPNLEWLGCGGELCDDTAMRHIGALPRLRMLQGQNTVATDEGFKALSRSRTLEYFWGRDCPNFTSRGFVSLSRLPTLRGLGVSCKLVDDAALSTLPRFPSLVELMPMDVQDEGFRHVGACERLERLWMMYCRDTTDAATEQIKGLSRLDTYYAGRTKITDRSLEILSGMTSLERLTFWETAEVTDAGVRLLARLPRLREVSLDGLPRVTPDALTAFPPSVRVSYMP